MANWGPVCDWAAVALPTFLAIVGVLVSIEAPRLESKKSRWAWRSGLILFGVLVSVVTWAQQKVAREIAQEETRLKYIPAGILVYENKRFVFYNKGKGTLYFWGDKLNDTPKDIGGSPRIIPVDAYYYLFGDRFEELILHTMGPNAEKVIPF